MKKVIFLLLNCFCLSVWAASLLPENVSVDSSGFYLNYSVYDHDHIADGSGLNGNQHINTADNFMWLSDMALGQSRKAATGTDMGEIWIKFTLDEVYEIDEIWIWNYNDQAYQRGLEDCVIQYSVDGTNWNYLYSDPGQTNKYFKLNPGTGSADYVANNIIEFGGIDVRYVVITSTTAIDGAGQIGTTGDGHYGLSEVRFYDTSFPQQAFDPIPFDTQRSVDVNSILTWQAGKNALSHNIYFSDYYEDIAFAEDTSASSFQINQTTATFDPGTLEQGSIYYWRVDEVQQDSSVIEGDVWSFVTAIPEEDPNLVPELICHWRLDETAGIYAMDSSGRKYHGLATGIEWTEGNICGAAEFYGPDEIQIPGAAFGPLDKEISIAFWQNGAFDAPPVYNSIIAAEGIDLNIHLPYVDTVWWDCAGSRVFKVASGSDYGGQWNHWVFTRNGLTGEQNIYLNGQIWRQTNDASAVALDGITSFKFGAGSGGHYQGLLDDFRVYKKALSSTEVLDLYNTPCFKAQYPQPPHNEQNVEIDTDLSWTESSIADPVNGQDVYFGEDSFAVRNADTAGAQYKGSQSGTTFDPGILDFDTNYFWRIDQVDDPNVYKGDLWRFDTANFITLDGFENYDTSENLITSVWQTTGTASISLATDFDNSGSQSMKIDYNNSAGQVAEVFMTPPKTNWPGYNVDALVLYFHGIETNTAQQLYITVSDSSQSLTVNYAEDADVISEDWQDWIQWNIDLADFSGIDLSDVSNITVGISGTGSGTVYIDDIRLYPIRCRGELVPGDMDGDCEAGSFELEELIENWLTEGVTVSASAPSDPCNPRLWYKFDSGSGTKAADSSSYARDGSISGSGYWSTDGINGSNCISFDGSQEVTVPVEAFATVDDAVTVTCWIKDASPVQPPQYSTLFHGTPASGGGAVILRAFVPDSDGDVGIQAGSNGTAVDGVQWLSKDPDDWRTDWNHYAFVKDSVNGLLRIYHNGVLVAEDEESSYSFSEGFADFFIGDASWGGQGFIGKVDDFRIYDYPLSQSEVIWIYGQSSVFQPLLSGADTDLNNKVDFADFANVAKAWISEIYWP